MSSSDVLRFQIQAFQAQTTAPNQAFFELLRLVLRHETLDYALEKLEYITNADLEGKPANDENDVEDSSHQEVEGNPLLGSADRRDLMLFQLGLVEVDAVSANGDARN